MQLVVDLCIYVSNILSYFSCYGQLNVNGTSKYTGNPGKDNIQLSDNVCKLALSTVNVFASYSVSESSS